jgi:type I restriction enzyme M protein
MNIRKGLKAFNKTNPITLEDFSDIIDWWYDRKENYYAWKVNIEDIIDYNLDIKNPNSVAELIDQPPHEMISNILMESTK